MESVTFDAAAVGAKAPGETTDESSLESYLNTTVLF